MKKAQMEIIGLALVVVIITLAFGFVLATTLQKQETPTTKKYLAEELPAETISAMLRTTVQCDKLKAQISELLRSCIAETCECRDKNIKTILDMTYKDKGYDYEFLAGNTEFLQGSCERKEYTSKKIIIPSAANEIEVSLKLC